MERQTVYIVQSEHQHGRRKSPVVGNSIEVIRRCNWGQRLAMIYDKVPGIPQRCVLTDEKASSRVKTSA